MPTFPNTTISGFRYKHYRELPRKFQEYTDSWEYEDGGRDFNRRTSSPPREWRIVYGPLTKTQADTMDAFWELVGIDGTFDFTAKSGTTYTNVRIKTYDRTHEEHKSWRNFVTFELIKYS